jgi:hypothetical protein
MKKLYLLVLFSAFITIANAQDEGTIIKKARLERSKGIFIGGGPSFTLGKNIGDYSKGLNFEAGYLTRLNRVISIGPSVSYINFKYDQEKTGLNNVFFSEEMYDPYTYNYRYGLYVDFKGGDLTLLSAAFNLKINFIPVTDNSKVSIYGFVKPFVTMAKRKEVKGTATVFAVYDSDESGTYDEEEIEVALASSVEIPWEAGDPSWQELGVTISDDLKEDSKITGGVFLGPGIEFMPAQNVSFYLQGAFGYTFPVSFVSTKKYEGNDLNKIDEKYPVTKEGFPSINVQVGLTFNF